MSADSEQTKELNTVTVWCSVAHCESSLTPLSVFGWKCFMCVVWAECEKPRPFDTLSLHKAGDTQRRPKMSLFNPLKSHECLTFSQPHSDGFIRIFIIATSGWPPCVRVLTPTHTHTHTHTHTPLPRPRCECERLELSIKWPTKRSSDLSGSCSDGSFLCSVWSDQRSDFSPHSLHFITHTHTHCMYCCTWSIQWHEPFINAASASSHPSYAPPLYIVQYVLAVTHIQAKQKGNKVKQMCKVFLDAQRQKQTKGAGFTDAKQAMIERHSGAGVDTSASTTW